MKFENPSAGWAELFKGARAHVQKVVQGNYSGKAVIVRDTRKLRITCYAPVRFGGSSFIIGKPTSYENGVLVLQPIFQPATGKMPSELTPP